MSNNSNDYLEDLQLHRPSHTSWPSCHQPLLLARTWSPADTSHSDRAWRRRSCGPGCSAPGTLRARRGLRLRRGPCHRCCRTSLWSSARSPQGLKTITLDYMWNRAFVYILTPSWALGSTSDFNFGLRTTFSSSAKSRDTSQPISSGKPMVPPEAICISSGSCFNLWRVRVENGNVHLLLYLLYLLT